MDKSQQRTHRNQDSKTTKTILKRAPEYPIESRDPPKKKRLIKLFEQIDECHNQNDKDLFEATQNQKEKLVRLLEEIRKQNKDKASKKQRSQTRKSVVFDQGLNVQYDSDKKWNTTIEDEKKGPFSEEEKQILFKSICKYACENSLTIDEIQEQIFYNVNPHRREAMWTTISSVLPQRSINSCFKYLRRKLDPKNNQGHWTAEEEEELKGLVEQYGRKWTKISKELNRSSQNVRDKYRNIGQEKNEDRSLLFWKMEELIVFFKTLEKELQTRFLDKQLKTKVTSFEIHDSTEMKQREGQKARKRNSQTFIFHNLSVLLNFINLKKLSEVDFSGISWSKISRAVSTKSKDDCRNKWKQVCNIISSRQDSYTPKQDQHLIQVIEAQDVYNQFEINFDIENGHNAEHNKARWSVLKKFASGRVSKNFKDVIREIKTKVFRNQESLPMTEENQILKMFIAMKKGKQNSD